MRNFALQPLDVEQLGEKGYFVRNRCLAPDTCRVLRRTIDQMARATERHGIDRERRHRRTAPGRGDYLTWLDRTDEYPWDLVAERFEQLRVDLNRMGYLGLREFDVRIARYSDDGSSVDRYVETPGPDSDRRVTATVYLNPGWEAPDGGELRLSPPSAGEPVDIAPIAGRLVAYRDDEVDREVLPTHAPRYGLSSWYRGRAPRRPTL